MENDRRYLKSTTKVVSCFVFYLQSFYVVYLREYYQHPFKFYKKTRLLVGVAPPFKRLKFKAAYSVRSTEAKATKGKLFPIIFYSMSLEGW